MKICCVITALALVVASYGCGGSSSTAASAEGGSAETTSSTTTAAKKARYPVPAAVPGQTPLHKLVVKDLEAGEGPMAGWGDEVTVRYVGVYYRTGKLYSQHWGFSYSFKLDGKTIGPGWQKGIHGMRVGGRREILIPSRLIWSGADGDLAYILELQKVKAGGRADKAGGAPDRPGSSSYAQKGPFAAITMRKGKKKPLIDPPDRPPPKELLTRDLEVGSGPAAQEGDEADVYYAGAIYRTGKVRYYGWRPFPPPGVLLGAGLWGKAWEEGIEGMRVGGRREVVIPSRFLSGSPAVDYVIELVSLKQAASDQ